MSPPIKIEANPIGQSNPPSPIHTSQLKFPVPVTQIRTVSPIRKPHSAPHQSHSPKTTDHSQPLQICSPPNCPPNFPTTHILPFNSNADIYSIVRYTRPLTNMSSHSSFYPTHHSFSTHRPMSSQAIRIPSHSDKQQHHYDDITKYRIQQ